MRLINANALEKEILAERDKIPENIPCATYELRDCKPNRDGQLIRAGIRKALRCLSNAPTIDAVPVVRCKDCKHWDKNEGECSHWYGFRENDFCSYGERKEVTP